VASPGTPRPPLRFPPIPVQSRVRPPPRRCRDRCRGSREETPRVLAHAALTGRRTSECSGRLSAPPLIRHVRRTGEAAACGPTALRDPACHQGGQPIPRLNVPALGDRPPFPGWVRHLAAQAFALSAFPNLAEAQQPPGKVARIGYLTAPSGPAPVDEAFREALRQVGYVEGQDIVIEYCRLFHRRQSIAM